MLLLFFKSSGTPPAGPVRTATPVPLMGAGGC